MTLPAIDSKYLPSLSTTSSNQLLLPETLCGERWNILKTKENLDKELLSHYNQQIKKLQVFESSSSKTITDQYNLIYVETKLCNPPLPNVQRKLFLEYCLHVIQKGSTKPFPKEADLLVWIAKHRGTQLEKSTAKINRMCKKLFHLVAEKEKQSILVQNDLYLHTEKFNVKKDAKLRWMMETNHSKRDDFYTLWSLVVDNHLSALKTLVSSERFQVQYTEGINTYDPDHGLTALHYACKHNRADIVHYLLSLQAEVGRCGADGRTPLHYAAAYSTRSVIVALLGAGADYDAKDSYFCSALDLALQNGNKEGVEVLRRWKELLPPPLLEEEPSPPALPDNVPEEYAGANPVVLSQLSSTLQLLLKRLERYNPYLSPSDSPSPLLLAPLSLPLSTLLSSRDLLSLQMELRLLSRASLLCLQEGWEEGGRRLLGRRWGVAKEALRREMEKDAEVEEEEREMLLNQGEKREGEERVVGDKREEGGDRGGAEREDEQKNTEETEKRVEASTGTPSISLEKLSSTFLATYSCISYEEEREKVYDLEGPGEGVRKTGLTKVSPSLYIEETAPQLSATFSGFDYGAELYPPREAGVEGGGEDFSSSSSFKPADYITQSIEQYVNHEQIRRLMLYPFDHEVPSLLDHYTVFSTTTYSPMDSASSLPTALFSRLTEEGKGEVTFTHWGLVKLGLEYVKICLICKSYFQAMRVLEECLDYYNFTYPMDYHDFPARLAGNCFAAHSEAFSPVSSIYPGKRSNRKIRLSSRIELLLMKCDLLLHFVDINHDSNANASVSVKEKNSLLMIESSLNTEAKEREDYLSDCLLAAQEALDLSYLLSKHLLTEYYGVALALRYIAWIRERLGEGTVALHALEEALVIARRAGKERKETVEIALEALRMYVKYGLFDLKDFDSVSGRSVEVFALINTCYQYYCTSSTPSLFTAFDKVEAERKCSELIAMATVLKDEVQTNANFTSLTVMPPDSLGQCSLANLNSSVWSSLSIKKTNRKPLLF